MSRMTSEDYYNKAHWWVSLGVWPVRWIWMLAGVSILYTLFFDPFEHLPEVLVCLFFIPTVPFMIFIEMKYKKYNKLAYRAKWNEREQEDKELNRQYREVLLKDEKDLHQSLIDYARSK